jgi:O-antigen ligase
MELHTLIGRAREKARGGDLSLFLSRALTVTLGIYIFIIPFPYRTAIQEICFYSSLALMAFLYGVKKPSISFNTPLSGPFLFFAAWVFVSLFFSIDKTNSFHDFFAYLLKDVALFILVYNIFSTKKRFTFLTWLIIVSGAFFSIGGMIYFYWVLKMPLAMRIGLPEVGIGGNYIGYVTVLTIFFSVTHFLHSRSNLGTWVSFFSVAGATLVTLFAQVKGTLLGFIPLLGVLFEKKRSLVVVLIVVGLLISVMPVRQLFTTDPDVLRRLDGGRVLIWDYYIPIIKDHPVTGIGFGMQTYRKEIINPDYEIIPSYKEVFAPHNTFVDVAVRCGVPGLMFFLCILFAFARTGIGVIQNSHDPFIKGWALCLMAVFASYLIQGLFSDMLLGIQVKYFFIIFALMAILWKWHAEHRATLKDVAS